MKASGERGSAPLEFILVTAGLLLPLAYATVATVETASAVLATTHAAREAGRAFVSAAAPAAARARALAAARLAFSDQGLDLPPGSVRIRCSGGPCLAPGSSVDVDVQWQLTLPWPIPISAHQHLPVDEYRGDPVNGDPT